MHKGTALKNTISSSLAVMRDEQMKEREGQLLPAQLMVEARLTPSGNVQTLTGYLSH